MDLLNQNYFYVNNNNVHRLGKNVYFYKYLALKLIMGTVSTYKVKSLENL